ncbi:AAA family ATPase [Paenibacillus sonchi]|uniref:AAA family ATPase n=1 Tax=Paenibacillus sonchi TaxID=373687 RepID=A0A974P8T0_9BACL|nr:AAA family ATPase [Paenibacillus sonchi]QQZ58908.1 AAA family ATPase [Paenibacillus sonchi]
MINKIIVRNKASYDAAGITLDNLEKVNFIYGANGSGKTTISDFLKNTSIYPHCQVSWTNNLELRRIVYNKEFIEENFHQNSDIKGIFTLGKESQEIQRKIEQIRTNINKVSDDISALENNIQDKREAQNQNDKEFEEICWKLKQKYDDIFQEAFTGFRGRKAKFKEKCKLESQSTHELEALNQLKEKCSDIFKGQKEKIELVRNLEYEQCNVASTDSIFNTKIIGQEDLDISQLIAKLNISDWVRQGQSHLHQADGVCPFCQRKLEQEFIVKLDQLFDENFNKKIQHLELAITLYSKSVGDIFERIDGILKLDNVFLDKQGLGSKKSAADAKHQANLLLLSLKKSEPSRSVELELLDEEFFSINSLIKAANEQITNHNKLIDNYHLERNNLISRIWKFIASENANAHKTYVENEFRLNRMIDGMSHSLANKKKMKQMFVKQIVELENQITSVVPSINEMNKILNSFNFTNFKFSEPTEKGSYRIVREDGENAKDTLSEGEKTFVTFLYFIQLINGSNDRSRITDNKIVVIDDPISSLDSNIVFIVSNLIRDIIEKIRNNNHSTIKQLFVLTHNIYFHKEVTFNKGKGTNKLADETFWILRKVNNVSCIKSYDTNPIKSSYELMWQEIKYTNERSSSTIQNLIRRIIENYFKIYGNYKEEDIIEKFENEEKVICRSLISWANDGSHYIMDDLYTEVTSDTVEKYLFVFKKMFEVTGHSAHYNMMMGITDDSLALSS